MLQEKILAVPQEQRAKVRAEELIKARSFLAPKQIVFEKKYKFEIIELKKHTENSVAVFARVYKDGKQLGFGLDGSVDIERFIFVNPPLLAQDEAGDISFDVFNGNNEKIGETRFKEDPIEALIQALEHTVDVMKNKHSSSRIKKGKVGTTTTTVYSDGGDAIVRKASASWTTVRDAAAGDTVASTSPAYTAWEKEGSTYNGYQPFFMFDTSVIPSTDIISSATFSVRKNGDSAVADSQQMTVANSTQATWNSIGTGDFDQRGGSTEGATRINCPTGTSTSYEDFPLNSTGLTFIAKSGETIPGSASASGKTQIAVRWSSDLDNSTPTGRTYMQIRLSEHTGTASDPKLVVEHAPSSEIKTINALAKASVKTVNGLAIASVKTFNGLA